MKANAVTIVRRMKAPFVYRYYRRMNRRPFRDLFEQFREERTGGRHHNGIRCFIQWWNRQAANPKQRMRKIKRSPPLKKLMPVERAALGSVIHTLCERDKVDIPQWVMDIEKLDKPTMSVSHVEFDDDFLEECMASAPSSCQKYNFYLFANDFNKGIPGAKAKEIKESMEALAEDM